MEPKDFNTQILIGIRDELKSLNNRFDGLTERVDDLTSYVGDMRRLQVESEMRVSTAIVEMTLEFRKLSEQLVQNSRLEARVTQCEEDIAALKQR